MILPRRCIVRLTLVVFVAIAGIGASGSRAVAEEEEQSDGCYTRITNPFSDVEWSCMYPIRMAGMNVSPSGPDPESKVSQILCTCQDGAFKRVGITIGFREPSRLLDVVFPAYCLASLGMDMGNSSGYGDGGQQSSPGSQTRSGFYEANTHYYYFNPLFILEILLDMSCLEKLPLDIVHMSEFDPLAKDDELGLLAFPETILFANPIAGLACIADAIATTVTTPIDALFWCAGSWGMVYPMTNSDPSPSGDMTVSAALVGSKYLARGHRELLNWGTKGEAAMCGPYPQPVWMKTQYKLQLIQPVKMRSCIPIGRTGMLWSPGKNLAVPGKDGNFSFIVWRYRDCCLF